MNTPTKLTTLGISTWLAAGLLMPACALIGVEPDEIDVADETGQLSSSGSTNGGDGDGDSGLDEGASDTSDGASSGDGDGDGDSDPTSTGDGDADGGDGDGDSGDGDSGDGDGDTGDTGMGDGDGDGDAGLDCASFDPKGVLEGENPINIPNVMSMFMGSCGAAGPDAVFSFTAPQDGSYQFTLASDAFEGVLYLVEGNCVPLEEIECKSEGEAIVHDMLLGEVVYIIVDSDANPGAATLTIAAI